MATQVITNRSEWLKGLKKDLKLKDKKEQSFYLRITGQIVGGCAVTEGYIAKVTYMFGDCKPVYYACKSLFHELQGWHYNVCYAKDINKRVTDKKQYIHEFKTLIEAINYLKLKK